MIHVVRINFEKDAPFQRECSRDEVISNHNAQQMLSAIISDLEQLPGDYCVVMHILPGNSLNIDHEVSNDLHHLMKHLTRREFQILELAIKGYSNKLISEKLFISVETVKSHRKSIVNKTGVSKVEEIKNWLLNKKI